MAWGQFTITKSSIQKRPDGTDGGNIEIDVEFVDEETGRKYTDRTWANDLTVDRVKEWAGKIQQVLIERDAAAAEMEAAVGQRLEPTPLVDSGPSPELVKFRQDWNNRVALKTLASSDQALSAKLEELTAATETYLKANPDAINDPMILR